MKEEKSVFLITFLLGMTLLCGGLFRLYTFNDVITEHGILYYGFDTYYHARRVCIIANDFTTLANIDYYSAYPFGLQFTWPPGFDYSIAIATYLSGLDLSDLLELELFISLIPLIWGVLTLLASYILLNLIVSRRVALGATMILAFLPAEVNVTLFGRPDHHSIEAFFLIILSAILLWWVKEEKAEDGAQRGYVFVLKRRLLPFLLFTVTLTFSFYFWMGSVIFVAFFCLLLLFQSVAELNYHQFDTSRWVYISLSFFCSTLLILPFYGSTRWAIDGYFWSYFPTLFQVLFLGGSFLFMVLISLTGSYASRKGDNWSFAIFMYSLTGFLSALGLKFFFPSLFSNLIHGIYLLLQHDVWLKHTSESQPLFFVQGSYSPEFAFISLGFAVLLLPLLAPLTILHIRYIKGKFDFSLLFLLFLTLFFGFISLISKRYVHFLGIITAIHTAYALDLLIHLPWLQRGIFKRGKAISSSILVLLLCLVLFFPSFVYYVKQAKQGFQGTMLTIEPYNRSMMDWIRENTPTPGDWLKSETMPQYGIFAPNIYGHWLSYRAQRAAVFSPFAVNFKLAAETFLSEDVTGFCRTADALNWRYILLNPPAFMIPQYAEVLNRPQIYQEELTYKDASGNISQEVKMKIAYYRLFLSRLYEFEGSSLRSPGLENLQPIDRFRLIRDADFLLNGPNGQVIVPLKLFEIVKGGILEGAFNPNSEYSVVVRMKTNVQRQFQYVQIFETDAEGRFRIRLPYSTVGAGRPVSVQPQGPYALYELNREKSRFIKNFDVDEEIVRNGGVLTLSLEKEE